MGPNPPFGGEQENICFHYLLAGLELKTWDHLLLKFATISFHLEAAKKHFANKTAADSWNQVQILLVCI